MMQVAAPTSAVTAPSNHLFGNPPHHAATVRAHHSNSRNDCMSVVSTVCDVLCSVQRVSMSIRSYLCASNATMHLWCCLSSVCTKQNNLPVALQKDAPATASAVIVRFCPLACATATGAGPPLPMSAAATAFADDPQQHAEVIVSQTHCRSTVNRSSQS